MWVKTSQLIPNCVLRSHALGKTERPIIPKNTILSEEHISVLKSFLIEHVKVSPQLVNGKPFNPQQIDAPETSREKQKSVPTVNEQQSFIDHYQTVIECYKRIFARWQSGFAINMPELRQLLLPLYERIDEIGTEIYSIHQYASKEDYFYHHSVSVGLLSAYLAQRMNYPFGDQLQIGLAGFLSDSGMSKLEPGIFLQDRKLTGSEEQEMKKHPTYSYRLVENIPTMKQSAKLAILQHHERLDRSGYPLGLKKEKIHTYARIIAVCDIYHAMTCERAYQRSQSPFKVVEELQTQRFTQLDPFVVQTFIEGLANFSIGSKVRLSTEEVGEIVFVQPKNPTRPIIRLDHENFIVLEKEPEIYIKEVII